MLLYIEVIDIDSIKSGTGKNCWWIGSPHCVNYNHSHIKQHYLRLGISWVPNSDSPISGGRDKSGGMIMIPSHLINCQQMPLIGFLILSWVSQWTLMDFAFFSPHQKWEIVKFVEIKAETTGQADERRLLFFFACEFEFKYFLGL